MPSFNEFPYHRQLGQEPERPNELRHEPDSLSSGSVVLADGDGHDKGISVSVRCLVETVRSGLIKAFKEVTMNAQSGVDRLVPESLLNNPRVLSLGYEKRGLGVPEPVERP